MKASPKMPATASWQTARPFPDGVPILVDAVKERLTSPAEIVRTLQSTALDPATYVFAKYQGIEGGAVLIVLCVAALGFHNSARARRRLRCRQSGRDAFP